MRTKRQCKFDIKQLSFNIKENKTYPPEHLHEISPRKNFIHLRQRICDLSFPFFSIQLPGKNFHCCQATKKQIFIKNIRFFCPGVVAGDVKIPNLQSNTMRDVIAGLSSEKLNKQDKFACAKRDVRVIEVQKTLNCFGN